MIANSTPLICLAKIGQLRLLKMLFGSVTITGAVKEEVLVEGKPGYSSISDAISEGWIRVANPKQVVELGLGKGENSSLSFAKESNDKLLIDDASAITAAKVLGIDFLRTTTILIMAVGRKIITKKQAVALMGQLVKAGYYISPRYLTEILTKLTA
ncbi:hypothetical protein HYU40_03630 [Candidatus Woesearchaeota archaeon]|nr:hypothetical protein [Candidatus Woesearchaeota archaeon]